MSLTPKTSKKPRKFNEFALKGVLPSPLFFTVGLKIFEIPFFEYYAKQIVFDT